MPKLHDIQPSFNTGELSPRLAARVDFAKFKTGVDTLQNMIPLPEGGAARRPGSRHVKELKSSSVKGRLKKFEFSTSQAYILEFGEQTIRFYRNQARIDSNDITASITNGDFPSGISSWTDQSGAGSSISHDATNNRMNIISNGTTDGHAEQQVTNASAVEHVLRFRVLGAPGDFIKLRIGTSSKGTQIVNDFQAYVGWHTYAFTATAADFYIQFLQTTAKTIQIDDVSLIDNSPIELTTPWTEAHLFDVEGSQSADILYLFHETDPTYKLERRGHTTWSLVEVLWEDGPYLELNETTTTMTPAAATGLGINVTASSIVGVNDGQGFLSTDVGRNIRIDNPASGVDWGWGVITSITSTTVAVVDIKRDFGDTTADTRWHLGAFSQTTGYPTIGTFYEQRLFCANTTNQPQTIWASQTADFQNMTPDSDPSTSGVFDGTVHDDDALDFTISADNVNAVFWMNSGEDTLAIGTSGGIWSPTSVGAVLTPSDITIRRQVTSSAAFQQPVRINNVVLYVQRAKRKIREFGFNFESDSFKAFDMTRLAQHITFGGIVEMDFAEEPDSQVWAVRNDGVLLSMTFRREEDTVGWGRHILGGSFGSGNAVVESVSVIPGANGAGQTQDSTNRDEVWLIVKRTINGATKRYIEFFERHYESGHDASDSYYVDSLLTYDSTSTTAMTGADHLEGETVKIWADSAIQPDKTVTSGAFTLDIAAATVQYGLGYTHKLKTLRIEGGNPAGTQVGKTARIYGITFVVLDSHILKFGPTTSSLQTIDFREVEDAMDTGVPLFTGNHFVDFEGDWGQDNRICIQDDSPAPFTLLALAPEIQVNSVK